MSDVDPLVEKLTDLTETLDTRCVALERKLDEILQPLRILTLLMIRDTFSRSTPEDSKLRCTGDVLLREAVKEFLEDTIRRNEDWYYPDSLKSELEKTEKGCK